ncbi:MAG: hypothetical protein DU429_04960 [Candidatus Tokpelaia sp.]|nr:MAG: hypothetical protein DU430_00950 [Candidatus Tokpelaia sp.]KAA6206972.1 MAG: hypothetical protein DU429_04960 [Candidatus Tokpelaia sp.]
MRLGESDQEYSLSETAGARVSRANRRGARKPCKPQGRAERANRRGWTGQPVRLACGGGRHKEQARVSCAKYDQAATYPASLP